MALHRACNMTFPRYTKLKTFFQNDWERAWNGSIQEWQKAEMDAKAIQTFFTSRKKVSLEQEMERLNRCGASVLVYGTPGYPLSLSQIHHPPVLLFCRGTLLAEDFPALSVVGSRRLSRYGQRAAEKIVGTIADAGITIVSGLAFGADTVAHRIALEHGARTIAVLGNGIDTIYPVANTAFAEQFLAEEKGVLLSEYLPGVEGRAEYFPVRNRIVSGLSRATILLEAAEKSGSLITAELAIQQNRDLFAVPGDIFSHTSVGCNQLIARGMAAPAIDGESILQALDVHHISSKKSVNRNLPLTENESLVLQLFDTQSEWHIDDLFRQGVLPSMVMSSVVSMLEIKGLLKNHGGQMYSRLV